MKEQEQKPNEQSTESVADLELNAERAEEIQAGTQFEFKPFSGGFTGGVRVAAGDIN